MIHIVIIILGFIILYQIIKLKCTNYKITEIFVLKNIMDCNWSGGTDKPFNLIENVPYLIGDKVYIEKIDKFVFNKIVETKFEIRHCWASDDYE